MTVLPADTVRTFSDEGLLPSSSLIVPTNECNDVLATLSPMPEPALYEATGVICQESVPSNSPTTLRIALVQGAVSFTEQFIGRLRNHGILPVLVGDPQTILRRLDLSLEDWNIVVYPIWTNWQRALDFAREVRRIRERHGSPPYPRVLILSFIEQVPAAAHWFVQTDGTRYSVFTSEENLVHMLWRMRDELANAQRACRVHLRFVHSGNPSGIGCIPGEHIVAAYGSFVSGHEHELTESKSVLRFINLLAASRWRFKSAIEIVDLMIRHPLYQRKDGIPEVLSPGSIKTYIGRTDDVFSALWRRSGCLCELPPMVIAKESRGNKEVAYRLLCTAEFEHI